MRLETSGRSPDSMGGIKVETRTRPGMIMELMDESDAAMDVYLTMARRCRVSFYLRLANFWS